MKLEQSRHCEIVRPDLRTPVGKVLDLTVLDQIASSHYTTFVLFFAPSPQQPLSVNHLKKSLSRTLSIFPLLAGRYVLLPNESGLELECNDQGVEFFDDSLNEKLANFDESRCQILCPCEEFPSRSITEVPLLLVQTTRFQCGGWSLAVAMHHNVGDGAAMSLFMKAWSHFASGSLERFDHHPCFDRDFFNSRRLPQTLDLKYIRDISHLVPSPQLKPCFFRFTSSQIQALKNQCGGNYTRFQVLAAHIWRHNAKLRKSGRKETKLVVAVDGRARLASLSKGYFGNATPSATAVAKVNDLIDKPLSFAAKIVHDAIRSVTVESLEGFLSWIQRQENLDMVPAIWSEVTVITSWSQFPLYELEFGSGKPAIVTSPGVRLAETFVFLPWSRDGTMTAIMQLRDEEIETLLASPEFLPSFS